MGRQRGLVHLTGQYGDVQLSINDGKGIAKLSVPVSKSRIANDPSYALTRKSNAEFKGASMAVTSLMACFGENALSFADRYLYSRLLKTARQVLKLGPGLNGQRSFEVLPNVDLLKVVELNLEDKLRLRCQVRYEVTANADRNTVTMVVPAFAPRQLLKAPNGATHFKLCLAIGVLSDVVFVSMDAGYAAAEPLLNGLSDLQYSQLYPLDGAQNAGFQLTATLTGLPVLPITTGLVVSVGIEFFVMVNNVEDVMAQGNAMGLHAIL